MNIDITLSAAETTPERVLHRNVAVIDVFRATSVMVTALEHGAKRIIPVTTVEEAIDLRKIYASRGETVITGGERNALLIEGFDRDNSPFSYMDPSISGKTIVMSTTNGTRAVNAARSAAAVYIAAILNYKAVCDYLAKQGRDITIVCAGRESRFTLEDALCAGMMVDYLSEQLPDAVLTDIAWGMQDLYRLHKDDLKAGLEHSQHYNDLIQLGFSRDIDYCLQPAGSNIVPILDKQFSVVQIE